MKLSKLYTNLSAIFEPILFRSGLNVIRAEIRMPAQLEADTHNLGKSTLGRVIDFCLLKSVDKNHFMKARPDLFGDFVFFLEIELSTGEYVTIRRSVDESSKASFRRHSEPNQDFSQYGEGEWDHWKLGKEKSQAVLDGCLDLTAYKPWNFRKGIGYQLRSQPDYRDVFQLENFAKGSHVHWKPFLSQILGLNSKLIEDQYLSEENVSQKRAKIAEVEAEIGGARIDVNAIEGLIQLKSEEVGSLDAALESFDFRLPDLRQTQSVVESIDRQIATLNETRYSIMSRVQRIDDSLEEEQIRFDTDETAQLFREAGVVFGGQIRRTFEQLISFNQAISTERSQYLMVEQEALNTELGEVQASLDILGAQRATALAFLSNTDPIQKYRDLSRRTIKQRADLEVLEMRRELASRVNDLKEELANLEYQSKDLARRVRANVNQNVAANSQSLFSSIRRDFSEVVRTVISRPALINVSINNEHHVEFEAYILDDNDQPTFEQDGYTYRKFLCIAFDLAMIRAHNKSEYPQFVFHDGVFDSVEARKKRQLMSVMRTCEKDGVQQIITMLDSDDVNGSPDKSLVRDDEVVLILHDEGESGRLFKMPSW